MPDECTPQTLPSVETVYPLAIQSYETAVKRFDALDSKLNTLVTFAVTVSLAIPVLANSKGISFHSYWFGVAALAFILGIGVATYARVMGTLYLLDPRVLYDSYLDLEPWQFKRHAIDWAGDNWQHNKNLINRNGNLAALAATLFALEAVAVGAWVWAANF
jgi:hypothetical protein